MRVSGGGTILTNVSQLEFLRSSGEGGWWRRRYSYSTNVSLQEFLRSSGEGGWWRGAILTNISLQEFLRSSGEGGWWRDAILTYTCMHLPRGM